MLIIYQLVVRFTAQFLRLIALFNPKIKLFVEGRKVVFHQLQEAITNSDKTIWFHAASLGEFEQGLPIMEAIKKKYPSHKIVVSFFSPSGYEVKKSNTIADVTVYLPLDTKRNAHNFIKAVHPDLVFFIKYEFWPNYLNELQQLQIKTFLVSGIFRKNQAFFKWYGGFYRKALEAFSYFFVQNESSKILIQRLGYQNVMISGDRVMNILERDNSLDFMDEFCTTNSKIIVIGSSWPKDEEMLLNYINTSAENIKFVIAPHNIKADQIKNLKSQIRKKTILFSEKEELLKQVQQDKVEDFQVFIIDTIGILTKIYSYADIAYVGGGFGNPGVHNILEPATFGIPIIIGPNYSHFAEATALVNLGGCISIKNQNQLKEIIDELLQNEDERLEKGHICRTFVQMNAGATEKISNQISKN
jgi:3-deoxy-D-manno-octulosonic-acid transferase